MRIRITPQPPAQRTVPRLPIVKESKGHERLHMIAIDVPSMVFEMPTIWRRPGFGDYAGQPTPVTVVLYRLIAELLQKFKPDSLVLCFDCTGAESYRQKIYPDYKLSNRPTQEEMLPDLAGIEDIARGLELTILRLAGAEAHDIIARLFAKLHTTGRPFGIITGRLLLASLLGPSVTMPRVTKPLEGRSLTPEGTIAGLTTAQIPDYLSLVGDRFENIPGVKGVGDKTAIKLLSTFGNLKGIYNNLTEIKQPALRRNLEADRENALLSARLVTFRDDFDLPADFPPSVNATRRYDLTVFRKMGLESLHEEWSELNTRLA